MYINIFNILGWASLWLVFILLSILAIFTLCLLIYSSQLAGGYNRFGLSTWGGNLRFFFIGLLLWVGFFNFSLLLANSVGHGCMLWRCGSILFQGDDYSIVYIGLIILLYPLILILMQYDFGIKSGQYFSLMVLLYLFIILFIFSANLIVFYIVYEFMIFLVFYIMYSTANSRGGLEAILFFLGWAVIGSLLVGCGILYIIIITGQSNFNLVASFSFTPNECYFLYSLFFFGLGTKLSIWPFWY